MGPLKAKDAVRTSTLRMLISAVPNKEIEEKEGTAEADILA